MIRNNARIAWTIALMLALSGCTRWQGPDGANPHGMRFKFVGCSGDWPAELPIKPIITREAGAQHAWFVRDPVECGMDVAAPRYALSGNTLTLSYAVHLPDSGEVAACLCAYDSRFTFQTLPDTITNVRFRQR